MKGKIVSGEKFGESCKILALRKKILTKLITMCARYV